MGILIGVWFALRSQSPSTLSQPIDNQIIEDDQEYLETRARVFEALEEYNDNQ